MVTEPSRDVVVDDALSRSPLLRAQLGVLLHLARATHVGRLDLLRAARMHAARGSDRLTWIHYVDLIADTYARQAPHVSGDADAIRIMALVANEGIVTTSHPEVAASLERMRGAIEIALEQGQDPVQYLADANLHAHEAIRQWLDEHDVISNLTTEPARLRVSHSKTPDLACAVSDTISRRIGWTVGPTDVAFLSAMQATSILKHEYLSHFAPRHDRLKAEVREGWLMDVLLEEMDRAEPAEREADVMALHYLRTRLAAQYGQNTGDRTSFDYYAGLRDLAERVRFVDEELYWQLTRVVLGVRGKDEDLVARMEAALRELSMSGRAELSRVADSDEGRDISQILQEIRARR